MKKIILTILLVTFTIITNAQNTFTAKVVDIDNNQSLIGATLLLKGTTNGVSIDINGRATLKNIPNGKQIISISFIGYEDEYLTLTFPVESKKTHTISLSKSDTEIDEIIIGLLTATVVTEYMSAELVKSINPNVAA